MAGLRTECASAQVLVVLGDEDEVWDGNVAWIFNKNECDSNYKLTKVI